MPLRHLVTLTVALLFGSALVGCGNNTVPPVAQTPPTTLAGNWIIAGTRSPATFPMLSTSFAVVGNQIFGMGNVQIQCSPQSGIGGSVLLTGLVAVDGSFTASYSAPSLGPMNTYQVSVSGKSPTAASPAPWTGTYTLSATTSNRDGSPLCSYNQKGDFTATPVRPLAGTYTGPVSSPPILTTTFGANASYILEVNQGASMLVSRGTGTEYVLPLAATLTVIGSACFKSGTTTGSTVVSNVGGDTLQLGFLMDDGSRLTLSGYLADPGGAALSITSFNLGGSCGNGLAFTVLTRS